MSRLESAATIEAKVGAKRHPSEHLGRAVSATERVYVLHSDECVARGVDLRECEFSLALDEGIDLEVWDRYQDRPVLVVVDADSGRLHPRLYAGGDLGPTDALAPGWHVVDGVEFHLGGLNLIRWRSDCSQCVGYGKGAFAPDHDPMPGCSYSTRRSHCSCDACF